MSKIKYWMWLACLTNLRPRAKIDALEHFGNNVEELFFAGGKELSAISGIRPGDLRHLENKSMAQAMHALDICEQNDIQIIAWGDSAYPRRLSHIYDPPAVLFVKGRMPMIDEECAIAIAGTRKCTPYGDKMARKLGGDLTNGGALVVSGLAEGIDSSAAYGALSAGGKCVGVLGCAIDEVYPRFNKSLFKDVAANGALISEYPPGTEYNRNRFPQRNRILSGLSVGVVIVEAPERSGSLITADYATEQGRDVFAVPGNADSPHCAGSNALLQDCAKLTQRAWDVLCEYEGLYPHRIRKPEQQREARPVQDKIPQVKAEKTVSPAKKDIDKPKDLAYIDLEEKLSGLSPVQRRIIEAMDGDTFADTIISKTSLTAAEVMSELTMLEIMDVIVSLGFDKYRLNLE